VFTTGGLPENAICVKLFSSSFPHILFRLLDSISSWIGFEVDLLNTELVKIVNYVNENGMELTIKDSGFAIFLQSIKYRYYPIFMLVLMMILIFAGRDFGPMLLAERQVRVYDRTDGGPNKAKSGDLESSGDNQPREDQPLLAVNMLLPVLILVALIFLALVRSGDDGSGTQTFMEKIEASDSFISLLYGVRYPKLLLDFYRNTRFNISFHISSTLHNTTDHGNGLDYDSFVPCPGDHSWDEQIDTSYTQGFLGYDAVAKGESRRATTIPHVGFRVSRILSIRNESYLLGLGRLDIGMGIGLGDDCRWL
jgi:hypothetical protein